MLLNAFNDRKYWAEYKLKDFGDYAEMVEYVNDRPDCFDSNRGDWFYGDDERKILYSGTYGNDHSPGASMYTYAEILTPEEYRQALEKWNKAPAYLE